MTMLRRFLPLALLVPLVLSGCDTAEDNTFFLDAEEVSLDFSFDGDALTPGQFTEISTAESARLVDAIEDAGFTVEDVVSVRIADGSGEISVLLPIGTPIGTFDRARLRLTQGTRPALTVASQTDFPDSGTRTDLDIEGADLSAFVVNGTFSALLDIDPSMPVSEAYLVNVSFDVIVEVSL